MFSSKKIPCNRQYLSALHVFCVLLLGMSIACRKEADGIVWEQLNSTSDLSLESVRFYDAEIGLIGGGGLFGETVLLRTTNGGASFQHIETGTDKAVFDIFFVDSATVRACAPDNTILYSSDNALTWTLNHPYYPDLSWQPLRALHFMNKDTGFVVGGNTGSLGLIGKTTDGGASWQGSLFDNEWRDICFVNEQTGFVCGFGGVFRTHNAGEKWERLSLSGDFFMSIHFPSPIVGYVVGDQGTIAKTDDGGDTWTILRNGNRLFQKSRHFTSVWFDDTETGWLAGNCLLWHTNDGGETWQSINDLNFVRFNDICRAADGVLYAVGDKGAIIKIMD